jgi:sporulation protein YunB
MRYSLVYAYEKGGVKRAVCLFLVSLLGFAAIFIWINIKIRPLVVSVTEGYAKTLVSYDLNSVVKEELEKRDYDFVNVQKDSSGRVMAVSLNAVETNLLKSSLIITLRERDGQPEAKYVRIPLGNFLHNQFFSGLGPKIPVRFLILTNTAVEVNDAFVSEGINQTLYSVSLDIKTSVEIYIPTMSNTLEVENVIPIAQTLIAGEVPDSYTGISGAEGGAADIALNTLD